MIIQNKQKDFPIIYLRYLNNKLMYIGETHSFLGARHVREDISAGNFDIVKILKAPKDLKRRHYWEAYLIVKLKPLMNMQIDVYQYRYKIGNNIETKNLSNICLNNFPLIIISKGWFHSRFPTQCL